jgi:50S ribosomal protein L16 3-hydroxylase
VPHWRGFDAERFVSDVWQKRPLLMRNPWMRWTNPLEPNELAGLACEAGVESRLVRRVAADNWELEQGPFPPTRFADLGEAPWTLLVQAVDHHIPSVASLLDPFRFIPTWRVDDVMVSYAVEGGGVGAHFDHYDVFLIQGLGRRRWRIGQKCNETTPILPHDDLRLLGGFEAVEEWVLEPGDILYVPPGFAHDGVAVGDDCMTYSVGFRAPSRSELVSAWSDHVLDTLHEDDRYGDPDLRRQANPGEISTTALARLYSMTAEALSNAEKFASWFGEFTTAPKDDQLDWAPDAPVSADDLLARAASGTSLERNPASRFSFIRQGAGELTLFVDGVSYRCSGAAPAFAEQLCASTRLALDAEVVACPVGANLVLDLLNRGSVGFGVPQ